MQFILLLVRGQCGQDYDCLYRTYYSVMLNLERRFNLPAAIYVGDEIVKIAHKRKTLSAEAQAHLDLYRFHDALSNGRSAARHIEKALRLYERTGDQSRIALCKLWKLNSSLKHRKIEDVLLAVEALLDEAVARGDSEIIIRLHKNLVNLSFSAGEYGKMAGHLDALESVAKPNPLTRSEKGFWILILMGRGDICREEKAFEKAKSFYIDALRLSTDVADRWLEIRCLHSLAETEWEIGNRLSAKSFINRAYASADELKMVDMLAHSFQVKAGFAEAEGQYADALEFTKKMQMHRDDLTNRGAGANAQKYYLEVEKETLEEEQKEKAANLRYLLVITVFTLLIILILTWAFFNLRRKRKALTVQNNLIRQQARRLESLDAAKSRFFANVSHELRTPLTLMLGPVHSLLKENRLTEKQTRLLEIASHSGKQLEQLVAEILDLRKLEMGKMDLVEKPTELPSFFRTYFMQFESLAHHKQIDFSFETKIERQLTAKIDQVKCRQILYNLLSNAFKFTPAGERIRAEVSLNDGMIRITVADTGPGIHPDDLPHVFDRFFQTNRPDKPVEGGTGIGLNLCKEYARLLGGTIDVESTPGKGSVFQVAFPVTMVDRPLPVTDDQATTGVNSETSPPRGLRGSGLAPSANNEFIQPLSVKHEPNKTLPETAGSSHRQTILVVEDNPELQEYLRLILSEKYHVVTAENGQAALGMMNGECGMMNDECGMMNDEWRMMNPNNRNENATIHHSSLPIPHSSFIIPDLILSDLMMPVMDGFQLLEKLKSDDATRLIPVIMLTARADVRDKLNALRIGVDDYLLKPFNEEELLVRIDNLLKNQAARKEALVGDAEPGESAPDISETDRTWLKAFETYVQQHFSDDLLSVSGLAHEFAMSESTLLRQLKRLTGLTPIQYLQEVRLGEARRLLENRTYDSIAHVASKVGYDDARSFSRSFKQRFGKLPSEMLGE
ncbi:MAG: helix-turn-helix domain-containing protein [Lewinellaceae bacterium]|nr:helix-turn-helix domain-containing protein [Lewinellaceae bacterium]